jgi:hypothetical protein
MSEYFEVWNIVHTIDDYYDGPRAGATEFEGKPYWYRSIYLDTEKWDHDEDRFELTPISPEALSWDLELNTIFGRWDNALKAGSVDWKMGDEDSFGALPDEARRYRELKTKFDSYLAETKPAFLAHGRFESPPLRAEWRIISAIDA